VSASAGGTPTSTVTFTVYGPGDANCTWKPVYAPAAVDLDAHGAAATSNSTFSVAANSGGTCRWLVVYSGDDSHTGFTKPCGAEPFNATITAG